ncbi:MAG: amidohydrolase family protein [Acidobacteria bacterium]|nr:amidohydrolase family protein [Acidobacteriota bacterium]
MKDSLKIIKSLLCVLLLAICALGQAPVVTLEHRNFAGLHEADSAIIAFESKPLALIHATVIDATGAPAKADMTVIIAGDRIAALGKTGKVSLPKRAEIIDATGKFLIPGLWDMHVHSGGYENGKKNFPLLLASGITGVRDMGTPLEEILNLRAEIAEGKILAPRLIAAGPLVQGPLPFQNPIFISVNNQAEARQTVAFLKKRGVDFIKVQDAITRDLYFALADESKRLKIPFAGHLPPSISATEASNAGQRSIEHLGGRFYGVLLACSERETALTEKVNAIIEDVIKAFRENREPDDSAIFRADFTKPLFDSFSEQKAKTLFAIFLKNGTWQVPTLIAQPVREAINERKDLSEDDLGYAKKLAQRQLDLVAAMQRAGVKIMAGTDMPLDTQSLHEELALLVKAGLTPLEALLSATRNPAEFLGKLDSFGTVEKGKIADLVLLDANPLEDIRNTQKVSAVILGGKMMPKSFLQDLRKRR